MKTLLGMRPALARPNSPTFMNWTHKIYQIRGKVLFFNYSKTVVYQSTLICRYLTKLFEGAVHIKNLQ